MGNIIGSPFEDFVKKQIEIRQKSLGQRSNISTENLKYYTTKTPWLRLASSVDLTGEEGDGSVLSRLIDLGIDKSIITKDELAKKFILQGGTITLNEDKIKLQKGLNYNNDLFNGAYGWGGVSERGFVPMPGIEKAQTTYYNNGALSKAVISVKCYSKTQFALLDALYLRPGYSLLLEFGWSVFLNNTGDLEEQDSFKSSPLSFLLKPGSFEGDKNQYQMFQLIAEERAKYFGNYEACYGKITNFKWSFSTDGSYNCEITLVGMGDVLNSLKLNVTDPIKDNKGKNAVTTRLTPYDVFVKDIMGIYLARRIKNGTLDDISKLQKRAFIRSVKGYPNGEGLTSDSPISEINSFLKTEYDALIERQKSQAIENDNSDPILSNKDDTKLNKKFYELSQLLQNESVTEGGAFKDAFGIKDGAFILPNTFVGKRNAQSDGSTNIQASKSIYIKFGVLLKVIEDNCNLFSKKGEGGTPLIKFDFKYFNLKNDENYMLIIPPHISADPNKCLVTHNVMGFKDVLSFDTSDLPVDSPLNSYLTTTQNFIVENNPFVGRLGNVLINLRFASEAISKVPKNSDGARPVLPYVKNILKGINESMGSLNDFFVSYDEYEGVIKIYDLAPKPGLVKENITSFSKFNIFGVRKDEGSFITNVGLDSEIPEDFATQVVIGAQSSGNNLMGNSLSFSNYNKGLVDRIIPDKLDESTLNANVQTTGSDATKEAVILKEEKLYYPASGNKVSPIGSMYFKEGQYGAGSSGGQYYNFTPQVTSDLTENYTSYIQLVHGILTQKDLVPPPFFLPFNLNLEMEGLSGMRLFEKFRITDDVLPPSYAKDSVDIELLGVNHSVDVQKWSTVIDTLSVPRFIETTISGSVVADPVPSPTKKKLDEVEEPNGSEWEEWVNEVAWSAAFISWTVENAGVSFPNSSAHTIYSQKIRDGFQGWRVFDPKFTPLQVGDIVVKNRNKNTLTYNSSIWEGSSHGDIVTTVGGSQVYDPLTRTYSTTSPGFNQNFAEIIGGNVGNTVKKKKLSLTDSGLIKNPRKYFVVLRNNNPGLGANIAGIAKQEDLFWGGRNELDMNQELRLRLQAYYKSTPELRDSVPNSVYD
tara:strand:- start:1337 stop:4624 length:3288 start_codon:yes stop_codon:yes gene_type:complete